MAAPGGILPCPVLSSCLFYRLYGLSDYIPHGVCCLPHHLWRGVRVGTESEARTVMPQGAGQVFPDCTFLDISTFFILWYKWILEDKNSRFLFGERFNEFFKESSYQEFVDSCFLFSFSPIERFLYSLLRRKFWVFQGWDKPVFCLPIFTALKVNLVIFFPF